MELLNTLWGSCKDDDFIFPGRTPGNYISQEIIRRKLKQIWKDAGIEHEGQSKISQIN